jgi:hypothetical protein
MREGSIFPSFFGSTSAKYFAFFLGNISLSIYRVLLFNIGQSCLTIKEGNRMKKLVSLAGILNRLSLALVLIVIVGGFSTAWANNLDPWTAVGSAGTVDEADTSIVSLNERFASIAVTAQLPATLDIRYNVVAVDGLLQNSDAIRLRARFQDNGADARIILRLKEYNINTGSTTTRLTFDSDVLPADDIFQVGSVNSVCFEGNFFDFFNNAYSIDAEILKTGAGGKARLAIIEIGTIVC